MKEAYSPNLWPIMSMPTIIPFCRVGFIDGLTLGPSEETSSGEGYEPDGGTEVAWDNQRPMEVQDLPYWVRNPFWAEAQPTEKLWTDLMGGHWPDSSLIWAADGDSLCRMVGYDREEQIEIQRKPFGWWRHQ
jgi:hypothetical protein